MGIRGGGGDVWSIKYSYHHSEIFYEQMYLINGRLNTMTTYRFQNYLKTTTSKCDIN